MLCEAKFFNAIWLRRAFTLKLGRTRSILSETDRHHTEDSGKRDTQINSFTFKTITPPYPFPNKNTGLLLNCTSNCYTYQNGCWTAIPTSLCALNQTTQTCSITTEPVRQCLWFKRGWTLLYHYEACGNYLYWKEQRLASLQMILYASFF